MIKHKKIALGLSGILIYFLTRELLILPFILFNINFNDLGILIKTVYLISFDFLITMSLLYIFKDELLEAFKDFKVNHLHYFKKYIRYWYLALALMAVSNGLILQFTSQTASNQDAIVNLFKTNPIYIFFSAVIIAPILEELVFRLSFRYLFKNDWLFIFLSGITFGLIHVLGSANILSELIFVIPYSIPGFIFAYVLVKSRNIFVPMGLHFLHNGIMIALQFLVLILG